MPTSVITYEGDLRTSCVHVLSGNTIITDAPPDNNGKGQAFSPTDLLATSLGCCMITVMGIVANRHQISIDGLKAQITKIMGTNPRRIIQIDVSLAFPKNTYSTEQKELLQRTARTCPVALSLHPDIKQNIEFTWD